MNTQRAKTGFQSLLHQYHTFQQETNKFLKTPIFIHQEIYYIYILGEHIKDPEVLKHLSFYGNSFDVFVVIGHSGSAATSYWKSMVHSTSNDMKYTIEQISYRETVSLDESVYL